MDRSPLALRVAAVERDYLLVDLALFFSFAAWVPDGFRPLWLPIAFASCAAAFVFALDGIGRLIGAPVERMLARMRHETIVLSDDGFTLRPAVGRSTARCAWSDVTRVYAFKRDLVTTDSICLAFVTDDAIVETNERAGGWQELVDALPVKLACEPYATWYLDVMREPFEPRLRRIDLRADDERADTVEIEDIASEDVANDDVATGATTGAFDYLGFGTTGLLLAVAALLAAIALVRGPRSLASVAGVELVALACTRAALFGALAFRATVTRTR